MGDGYDRYFARSATPDWYADVSGSEPTKKGLDIEGGRTKASDFGHSSDQLMPRTHL